MSEEKKNPEKAKKPGIFARLARWFRSLSSELKKVTWPTKKQVTNNTWVVLVVTCVCAIFIWGFDSIAQLAIRTLITLAG